MYWYFYCSLHRPKRGFQPQKRLSASVARRLSASVVIADGAAALAGNRVERGAPAGLPSPNLFAAARGGGMPEKSGQMIKQNDHYLVS